MDNTAKFYEHKQMLAELRSGFLNGTINVYEMEKLKYSDDPLVRKAAAIIEYADEMYMDKMLGRDSR